MSQTLLLFDLDGTLVDSADIICAAQGQAFAALGLPAPSRERSLSIVGLSLSEAFSELAGKDGPVEALCEAYRQAFYALRTHPDALERLYPGAQDLITSLGQNETSMLGIATGKSQRGVRAICDAYGWNGVFKVIQTSDDAPSKPHPGMVLQASALSGIPLVRTLMIGDSSFDMKMAKSAGVSAIGVSWGFQSVPILRAAGADVIVESFDALAVALAAFNAGEREFEALQFEALQFEASQ